jgi:hypothetical protein
VSGGWCARDSVTHRVVSIALQGRALRKSPPDCRRGAGRVLPAFTAFLVSIPPATAGRTARRATAADAWGGPGTAVLMLVLLVLVLEKLRPAAAQGGGWRALDDGQGGGCCTDPIVTYGCRNFGPCHPTTVVHTTNGPVADVHVGSIAPGTIAEPSQRGFFSNSKPEKQGAAKSQ